MSKSCGGPEELVGPTIAKQNLEMFREHYVHVATSSPDFGGSSRLLGAGWYTDGLVPRRSRHGTTVQWRNPYKRNPSACRLGKINLFGWTSLCLARPRLAFTPASLRHRAIKGAPVGKSSFECGASPYRRRLRSSPLSWLCRPPERPSRERYFAIVYLH